MSDQTDGRGEEEYAGNGGLGARFRRFMRRMIAGEPSQNRKKQLSLPLLRSKAAEMRSDKLKYDYLIQKIRGSMDEIGALWKKRHPSVLRRGF